MEIIPVVIGVFVTGSMFILAIDTSDIRDIYSEL